MALFKRVVQSGSNLVKSRLRYATHKNSSFFSAAAGGKFEQVRHISIAIPSSAKSLVDTLPLMKRLESKGFPPEQAETIVSIVLDVVKKTNSVEKEFQKDEHLQGDHYEKQKTELDEAPEKRTAFFDRLLRNEMRKLKLDLEKRQIEDELTKQYAEIEDFEDELNRETEALRSALRAELKAQDDEFSKYGFYTVVIVAAYLGLVVGLLLIYYYILKKLWNILASLF